MYDTIIAYEFWKAKVLYRLHEILVGKFKSELKITGVGRMATFEPSIYSEHFFVATGKLLNILQSGLES